MRKLGRPGKAVATIDNRVSRRTKGELELRKQAEESLLSREKLFERKSVREDSEAHKEYLRVRKLLEKIGKADALYGAVLNRYCELYAETVACAARMKELNGIIDSLSEKFNALENVGYEEISAFGKQLTRLIGQVNSMDGLIMQKRKMMFDIEKENCMTVSSAIRTIPKSAAKTEENPLLKLLSEEGEEDGL